MKKEQEELFDTYSKDLLQDPNVLSMKNYIQHGRITTYEHVISVAKMAFVLACLLKIKVNFKVLIIAAILHDFYLYDWHKKSVHVPLFKMHGFTHPDAACQKAIEYFDIDKQTQDCIKTHMWPLNIFEIPKSKEAWLICVSDKLCATKEMVFER